MELKEALNKIETLLPSIQEYHKTGNIPASLDINKRLLLKEVWERHYQIGSSALCIDCPGVIKSALSLIQAYYDREIKAFRKEAPVKEVKHPKKRRGFLQ